MARVRFADLQSRPTECLDLPSLSLDELQPLLPPCEAAFQAHMAAWRLEGQPRTARRLRVDPPCPRPPPADRVLFLLVSLKTSALQVGHGRVFGMGQSTAHQGSHLLLPAWLAARRPLGAAPARALTALAQRLGVTEADAARVVTPLAEAPAPVAAAPAGAPASPLWPTTGRNGASSAPTPLRNRRRVRAASKRTTRSKRFGACRPCSSSSCSVTPRAVASRSSPWLPRRRSPCPPGVGGCRSWVCWR
jgi:hypothetical protein